MWEAIESNRRRSWILVTVMTFLLLALGSLIAAMIDPAIWWMGAAIALVVLGVMLAVAIGGGSRLLLAGAGARQLHSKTEHARLWNVVEEMSIAASLPEMPQVWIIEDNSPNAFATGRTPESSAVAVTTGLLRQLDRDELQGVVAHEIGHIVNRDIRFMTLAGILVGSIVLLSEVFLRYMWFSGGGRRRTDSKIDPRLQAALIVGGIVAALLAPLLARLLYFACSRQREYLADASAAVYTRYPPGLASALETIATRQSKHKGRREVSRVMAPMYIVNPLAAWGASGMFSTHPPTDKRIEVLRSMGGFAHLGAYDKAYRKVTGTGTSCVGPVALSEGGKPLEMREPTPEEKADKDPAERLHGVTELLDRLGDYVAIGCACGVGIKIPPGFQGDTVPCPRCGVTHAVPEAILTANDPDRPMRYERKSDGWESFRCPACGKPSHLSPAHAAPAVVCGGCKRKIEIVRGTAASRT